MSERFVRRSGLLVGEICISGRFAYRSGLYGGSVLEWGRLAGKMCGLYCRGPPYLSYPVVVSKKGMEWCTPTYCR